MRSAATAVYSSDALDFWWVRIPVRLRRHSVTLSAAWADGVYLTAWPPLAVLLPIVSVILGCTLGVSHWSPYVIRDGTTDLRGTIVVFAESLPFILIAAVLGSFSAQMGLLLTLGYAVGDFVIAGPATATWGYNSAWPPFFGVRLPLLLCYWLLFILAARTTLVANSLSAGLWRSVRANDVTAKVARVATAAAFQLGLVYAWTLVTPMVIRVLWIWVGRAYSPFSVPYYQKVTDPWVPLAAAAAVFARGFLMNRAVAKRTVARRLHVLTYFRRYSDQAPAFTRRMPVWVRAVVAAAAMTVFISGFLSSLLMATVMLVIFAVILLGRAVLVPRASAWVAWSRFVGRVPFALRIVAGAVLVFLITQVILATRGPLNPSGAFGMELICIVVGLIVMLGLIGEGEAAPGSAATSPLERRSTLIPSSAVGPARNAAITAIVLLGLLAPRNAYAICQDDFCCFVTFALVGLAVGALIILSIEFLLPMLGIELFATIAEETAEEAILEEEAAALARLQEMADAVNPLDGQENCQWVAREIDDGLTDMFAGRTPDPYAPNWYRAGTFAPDAAVRGEIGELADMSTLQSEYGSYFQKTSMERIAEQLQAAGNGARGLVTITGQGMGHVFNAVNYGGQVFFIDGQAGLVTTATDYFAGYEWAGSQVMFLPTI